MNRIAYTLLWAFFIVMLTVLPVFSAEPPDDRMVLSAEDQAELASLRKKMDYVTDIATRTLLNADYVPGMVSVFYGDALSEMGIRNVGEAMELVPGVYLSHAGKVYWKTVVRGIPRSFAPGSLKILLNGTPVTGSFGLDLLPNMPVEQIDRIEVIRGPGSAVHGEFACAGVINIITRTRGNRITAGVGTSEMVMAGTVLSYNRPESRFETAVNILGLDMEGADINTGPGLIITAAPDRENPSNAEGSPAPPEYQNDPVKNQDTEMVAPEKQNEINDAKQEYRSALVSLNWRNLSLKSHFLENGRGDLYETLQKGISGTFEIPLNSVFKANINFGYEAQRFDSENPGYHTADVTDIYSPGWIYGFSYDEHLLHAGLDLHVKWLESHHTLFGYSFLRSDLDDVKREDEIETVFNGRSRTVHSLLFQDEIRIHEQFTLTAGLRYDDYDDIGGVFSPRIAGVYRINTARNAKRHHLIKVQYARAFRPPTFLETEAIYQSTDVDFETVDTCELSYILTQHAITWRTTLFYSDLDARIDASQYREEPGRFSSYGAEFELNLPIIENHLMLESNLSRIFAEDRDSGQKIGESAQWLANIGLIFKPTRNLSFHWRQRIVADREPIRQNNTPAQDDPEDYGITDLSVSIRNIFKGLSIRAGVKNLFEEDIRNQSDSTNEILQQQYREADNEAESEDPERTWWIKLIYEF